jgi:LemA protein
MIAALAGFAALALLLYVITVYNSLVAVRREVDRAWANIDVLLKQRFDELPKLVEVCRAYMKYEQETLERVIRARAAFGAADSVENKARATGESAEPLRRLFAVAERYPDLEADQQFRNLRERISALETRIAERRETYNEVVNNHNVRIAQLPDLLLARPMGYGPLPWFAAEDFERPARKLDLETTR